MSPSAGKTFLKRKIVLELRETLYSSSQMNINVAVDIFWAETSCKTKSFITASWIGRILGINNLGIVVRLIKEKLVKQKNVWQKLWLVLSLESYFPSLLLTQQTDDNMLFWQVFRIVAHSHQLLMIGRWNKIKIINGNDVRNYVVWDRILHH